MIQETTFRKGLKKMDTTTFISALGVFAAMAGMAILIFKRVSPILIGPMAAILAVSYTHLSPYTVSREIACAIPGIDSP